MSASTSSSFRLALGLGLLVGCLIVHTCSAAGTEVFGNEGEHVDLSCDPAPNQSKTLFWQVVQKDTGSPIHILIKQPGQDITIPEQRYAGRLSLRDGNNLRISNLNRDDDSVDSTDSDFLGTYRCSQGAGQVGRQLILRVRHPPESVQIQSQHTSTVTVSLESDGHMTTTARTTPSIVTTPHLSTAKATTEMPPIMAADVQEDSSAKEHEVFTIGVIMSCAFVGLIFLSVVAVVAWVFKKRKATPRTSQLPLQENGTTSSVSGDGIAPRQETSLPILLPEYSIETIDTGLTSDADPPLSAVGLPVQVSSIHPYLQEPNFNPRLPIMVSLKTTTPQQRVGHLQNAAPDNGETTQTSPKLAAADNTPDRILRRNEETPPKDKAIARATKRSECKSAFSSTSADRATRPKAVANARQREDIRRSVSLDESTPSEPHTLCSNLPDSVSCPLLDEMISEKSTTEKEQEIRRETSREGGCEEKQSPAKRKEETGPKAGLFGSMETIVEDTAHIVKKKPPIGNQSGRKSLDVEALSLGGNKVATTIVQMIKKQLVGNGHFDLPYHKFSDLCLRLYNTAINWKVLAGKLGLTVEDVVLIDNCSAQHGLIAAEIVLRHWQRTADQDDMTPCNLQNLQDILTDMGRKDLVEMLKN